MPPAGTGRSSTGASSTIPEFDTVVLAGGKAARMDGADKPGLEVGGVSMLVLVARAAAAAGTRSLVVVGPERGGAVHAGLAEISSVLRDGLIRVREDPPGAGPVAALRCGLGEVSAPWVALLAADLPFLTGECLTDLLAAGASTGTDGVLLADEGGRLQWLTGAWRAEPLRRALACYEGRTLRGVLEPLRPVVRTLAVATGQAPWTDCDTPAELDAARAASRAARAQPR